MVKKIKLKMTKTLIPALFLLCIIAVVTPVAAVHPKRILFMSIGDDLDLPKTTNFMIGTIKFSRGSELPTAQVLFHSKICDESGDKVYAMTGMLKDGLLLKTDHYFYCPVFNIWWVNVWFVLGEGKFKTTDTDIEVFFRKSLSITMPNTEGKYKSANILMFLSPTAEYCLEDPGSYAPGTHPPIYIWPEGGWVLVGVLWDVGIPMDFGFGVGILPIGPISYLTISIGI